MYLFKLSSILLGSFLGQHCLSAQSDYYSRRDEKAEWKAVAGSSVEHPILIRFEPVEQLFLDKKPWMEKLEGRLECSLKLSLHSKKVRSVRLYWSSTAQVSKILIWRQKYLLRRVFRKMQFEVQGEVGKKIKSYRSTWLYSVQNGSFDKL